MKDKIEVLGVRIHQYTAKEAMEQVVSYMKTDALHVIELVTGQTLMQILKNEEYRIPFDEFDMTIAGNREILEAAGVHDAKYLKEIENRVFPKMLFRYWHKNHVRAFLFAESEEALKELTQYLGTHYSGIEIVDGAVLENDSNLDDTWTNRVNGAEVDCLITEVPAPCQEAFIMRCRNRLNAKIWMGLGTEFRDERRESSIGYRIRRFLNKFLLTKHIQKEKKDLE